MRVAAIQLSSQDDPAENIARVAHWVRQAAQAGAQLVVLPENFAFLGSEADKREVAERLGDSAAPIQAAIGALARELELVIVAGGMPELSGDSKRPYNTCAVFGRSGEVVAAYRKIHLFDVALPDGQVLAESRGVTAGTEPCAVDLLGFRCGLSVCYDLRFPELYRELIRAGAEVLLAPSAFTLQTGRDHWHLLVRARAVESTCWVVAANQWGRHPKGRASYGHTLVVDPWGTVVAQCSDGEGFVVADIDRGRLSEVRSRMPSLAHRRL